MDKAILAEKLRFKREELIAQPLARCWQDLAQLAIECLATQWQPIETAPRDGSKILVYRPYGSKHHMIGTDEWSVALGDVWQHSGFHNQPTHWQPLPKPPGE